MGAHYTFAVVVLFDSEANNHGGKLASEWSWHHLHIHENIGHWKCIHKAKCPCDTYGSSIKAATNR